MHANFDAAYSDVVIDAGVNLYPGQCLSITAEIGHYDLVCSLAEAAYRKGARYVEVVWDSSRLTRIRIDESGEEGLQFVPQYAVAKSYEQLANDWAFVRIESTEEQSFLEGVSPEKYAAMSRYRQSQLRRLQEELMSQKHAWCVIAAPGGKWGEKVLGIPDASEAVQAHREKLVPILRLDRDDPVQAWKDHARALQDRADKLTALRLDRLRFHSPVTDLTVGLNAGATWAGGPAFTPDRRMFLPNIPTEEVFTTPDYRRTEGRVQLTRPVTVLGELVTGAVLEFAQGRVVSFDADKGRDSLAKYLETDEGAAFLGEVSLVDCSSPIYQSGLLFYSTLFDENAACHIALGAGYVGCLPNGDGFKNDADRKAAGCNVSLVHEDVMIGSPDTDVTAIDQSGQETVLIKNGLFVV